MHITNWSLLYRLLTICSSCTISDIVPRKSDTTPPYFEPLNRGEPFIFRYQTYCTYHTKSWDISLLFFSDKKLVTRWEYPKVMWPISSYLFTYLRLSIDIHWTISSSIRHEVNLFLLMTFELELDSAWYIQSTDVRIADLCWARYIPSAHFDTQQTYV